LNYLWKFVKKPLADTAWKLRISWQESAYSRSVCAAGICVDSGIHGRKDMMKTVQTEAALRQSRARAVMVSAVIALVISAPSTLAEFTKHHAIAAIQAQAVSVPMVESRVTGVSDRPADTELERAVTRAAKQHRLHPALLFAVMKAESSFNPLVVSKAGAVGLMQLVPETAMRHGVQNLYDTNENVAGGARHLRYLLDRFHGNTRLALAAYNAGEGKVDRYKQIPPYKETRHYVQKVLSYYRDYRKEARLLPFGERQQEVFTIRTL
jgi:soluble lytic murein transglycosylase-like protein